MQSVSLELNALSLIGKRKNCTLRLLRSVVRTKFSICEIMKKENEIYASLAVAPQAAKVTASVLLS